MWKNKGIGVLFETLQTEKVIGGSGGKKSNCALKANWWIVVKVCSHDQ
jgi:hypothetical protein